MEVSMAEAHKRAYRHPKYKIPYQELAGVWAISSKSRRPTTLFWHRHRDRHIVEIRAKGRSEWKRQSGYYLQSHAENAFYRYKRIIGGRLRAKNEDAQKREAAIGCAILNRMREMGEPLSYAIE